MYEEIRRVWGLVGLGSVITAIMADSIAQLHYIDTRR